MSGPDNRVYQADPAACVKVARDSLVAAVAELRQDPPDLGSVDSHLSNALAWLPSWLEDEWDDRMTAWMERVGTSLRERVKAVLDHPYPDVMLTSFTDDQQAAVVVANAALRKSIKDDLAAALTPTDPHERTP